MNLGIMKKLSRLVTNGLYIFLVLNAEEEIFKNSLEPSAEKFLDEFMECSADGWGKVLCTLDWILSKNRSETGYTRCLFG